MTAANRPSFSRISSIQVNDASTWANSLFLTFDIDWASDEVLSYTIDIVEKANVPATWFVTHATSLLKRLRANPKFELGIHPNFNFLLNGDHRNGANASEVIDRMLEIVPEAKAVRSHSMTQSSGLLRLFVEKGLTHDCNHFIPEQSGIALKPWTLWNGMVRVPYFWEDDIACIYQENARIPDLISRPGLKVFDFHPIHVFLNTEHLDRYEKSRDVHLNSEKLAQHRCSEFGTCHHLESILGLS